MVFTTFIYSTYYLSIVDIAKYNSDGYKRMLGDLAKYSEYVQSYNETKVVEGNKVPKRVYQVVILEPDAVDLNVIKQAKASAVQNHIKQGEKSDKEITKEVEQIKKIENSGLRDDARQKLEAGIKDPPPVNLEGEIEVTKDGDIKEANLPPYEITKKLETKTPEEKKGKFDMVGEGN